jgi:hypothetical protein
MDNAVCGGGDTNIGLGNTAVPIQASAINMIKAVILMGNPRYIRGLPYNVGTCQAQGVGTLPRSIEYVLIEKFSSRLVHKDSLAHLQASSNRTAMLLTHIAVPAATKLRIKHMDPSTYIFSICLSTARYFLDARATDRVSF